MPKRYTVTDGRLVLYLTVCEEGGYCVTSPFDPALVTQAESVEEAFSMARDALKCLRATRLEIRRRGEEFWLNPASRREKSKRGRRAKPRRAVA
jgi:antitoxin HicB